MKINLVALIGLVMLFASCEPNSITEATEIAPQPAPPPLIDPTPQTYRQGFLDGYEEAIYIVQHFYPESWAIINQEGNCSISLSMQDDPGSSDDDDDGYPDEFEPGVQLIGSGCNSGAIITEMNRLRNSSTIQTNLTRYCDNYAQLSDYDQGFCSGFSFIFNQQPFSAG